jgi:hypothetical protein
MGPQRVLQAIVAVAIVAADGPAAAQPARERIAVIDLGAAVSSGGPAPRAAGDADPRPGLGAAIAAAGFAEVTGDGLEAALAGRDVDRDGVDLAAVLAVAQRAFGALACDDVLAAAQQAIGILAARQAAGLPTPELGRAWTYLLLCADRAGKRDVAQAAAAQLREAGGSADVPASVWASYPDVDAIANRELVEVELDADQPGAAIWVDFRPVGVAPVRVALAAGPHVIAAVGGGKRGWVAGTAIRSQRAVRVPLIDQAGPWRDLATRVAGWRGAVPPASELAWVLGRVRARVALIRHGDTIEAWGQVGRGEPPGPIGGADRVAPIAEVDRVLGLVADRVRSWNDRAPDPDRPLLVESGVQPFARSSRSADQAQPTRWWVYAVIAGAVVGGAAIIYAHDTARDQQRVELRYP